MQFKERSEWLDEIFSTTQENKHNSWIIYFKIVVKEKITVKIENMSSLDCWEILTVSYPCNSQAGHCKLYMILFDCPLSASNNGKECFSWFGLMKYGNLRQGILLQLLRWYPCFLPKLQTQAEQPQTWPERTIFFMSIHGVYAVWLLILAIYIEINVKTTLVPVFWLIRVLYIIFLSKI